MDKIDLSIICNVWNRHEFLKDALQSLIDQDYQGKTQVIVCDDGGTNEVAEVIEGFRPKFNVFDLIRENPTTEDRMKTSRLAIMINRALLLCRGRYISYLPDDDVYKPERNRMMVEFLDRNPDVFMAYHWMKFLLVSPDKAVVGESVDLCDPWDDAMRYWVENIYNRIDHTSIVHRNMREDNVCWDENVRFKRCVDWGFILRVLKRGLKVACVEAPLAIGRKIQGQSLNRDGDQMIANTVDKEDG